MLSLHPRAKTPSRPTDGEEQGHAWTPQPLPLFAPPRDVLAAAVHVYTRSPAALQERVARIAAAGRAMEEILSASSPSKKMARVRHSSRSMLELPLWVAALPCSFLQLCQHVARACRGMATGWGSVSVVDSFSIVSRPGGAITGRFPCALCCAQSMRR